MAANIHRMENESGIVYPITTADAVGMPDGSGSLTKKLREIESKISAGGGGGSQPGGGGTLPGGTLTKDAVEAVLTGDITSHNHQTEIAAALANALTNYVKKVNGKGLSTNDFTTVLKQKLEGLKNYDDAAVQRSIQTINSRIDTLVGTSASSAIDTFNEIEHFLAGITDSQSLTAMLADLKREITALIPSTGNLATKSEMQMVENKIPTQTSQLNNDSNFVSDVHYVHTDNNFTTAMKQKLEDLQPGGGGAGTGASVREIEVTEGDALPSRSETVMQICLTDNIPPSELPEPTIALDPISDKAYAPAEHSGLGRVNLPKGNGILTKEQVKLGNMVYVIQYDFDLNGQTVNFGADCILRYNGGSLKNGTVAFNNTLIEGDAKFIDVRPLGTLANEEIRMDWFTKTNGVYDTVYIKDFISFAKDGKHHYIMMSHRHLKPNNCIVSNFSNLTFVGDKVTSIIEISKELDRKAGAWGLGFLLSKNIHFKGIKLVAPSCESIVGPDGHEQNIMYATPVLGFDRCEDCGVVNCSFTEMPYVSPILLKQPKRMTIIHNTFMDYDSGVILHQDGDDTGVESDDLEEYSVKIADNYFGGSYQLSEPITFKSNRIFKLDIINNYISSKMGAAGIALKLFNTKSVCLVMGNVIERCGYGIGLEKSKCNYLIMNNKFISNQWCQVDLFDDANATLQGNYFVGTNIIVKAEAGRNITDAHINVLGNVFDNCGNFVGHCNFVISHNQYVNCTMQPTVDTDGNFTMTFNAKDAASTFTDVKVRYTKSVGKNKLMIMNNAFPVSISGLNSENIDAGSAIETSRPKIQAGPAGSFPTQDPNTLYFITE